MLISIYAVHDIKADAFGSPIHQVNDEVAVRCLAAVARDKESSIGQNPEDFNLYCLGSFDNASGAIGGLDKPRLVCTALSVSKPNPAEPALEVVE